MPLLCHLQTPNEALLSQRETPKTGLAETQLNHHWELSGFSRETQDLSTHADVHKPEGEPPRNPTRLLSILKHAFREVNCGVVLPKPPKNAQN